MKELEEKNQDKIEVHAQQHAEKQKHIGSFRLMNGHKVWQIDLTTNLITEAEYEEVQGEIIEGGHGEVKVHRKILVKENHLYCSALNQHNADKKFIKMIYGKTLKQMIAEQNLPLALNPIKGSDKTVGEFENGNWLEDNPPFGGGERL